MLSCEFCKVFKNTSFVKHWWTAAFEDHAYLNSMEEFPEFWSDDVSQKLRITFWKFYIKFFPKEQGMTYVVKILSEKS